MTRASNLVAILAFLVAGALAWGTAELGARWIERSSVRVVDETLVANGLDWVELYPDGLQLVLTGIAPTEASRFRAITLAGGVVDAERLIDAMDVVDPASLAPPRFSLEILRNDAGISLIGLVPTTGGRDALTAGLADLARSQQVTDMVETADHAVPETWDAALRFAMTALEDLPRSKISVEANRVEITAVSDSAEEKRALETRLSRRAPADVVLALNISAPRPVITPFILRATKSEDSFDFDACSADTEAARDTIMAAAIIAGFEGKADCVIGLGVPSTSWAAATSLGIAALSELPGGTLTFSDADVTLIASQGTEQVTFDRVVGRLKGDLPELFSLQAVLPPKLEDSGNTTIEAPEFVATLSPEGILQMRGRLRDESQESAVLSFARAYFGVSGTYIATRPMEALPGDWTTRVFAGLEGLSYLNNGALLVEAGVVELRGVTGRQSTTADLSRVLSAKLGQSARFVVDVRYDEMLDPLANIPTPEECVLRLNAVLAEKKITFDPGSATFDVSAIDQLNALADAFEDCDYVPMEIGGHTDSQGREEMNRGLSQQRADAVRNALIDRGVPPGILIAVGYGEAEPIADNDTEEGREANRRIAFTLSTEALAAQAPEIDDGEDAETAEIIDETGPNPPTTPLPRPVAEDTAVEPAPDETEQAPAPEVSE